MLGTNQTNKNQTKKTRTENRIWMRETVEKKDIDVEVDGRRILSANRNIFLSRLGCFYYFVKTIWIFFLRFCVMIWCVWSNAYKNIDFRLFHMHFLILEYESVEWESGEKAKKNEVIYIFYWPFRLLAETRMTNITNAMHCRRRETEELGKTPWNARNVLNL